MAKVTIIFKDSKDGNVNTRIEFDPPIEKRIHITPAQSMAAEIIQYLNDTLNSGEADND